MNLIYKGIMRALLFLFIKWGGVKRKIYSYINKAYCKLNCSRINIETVRFDGYARLKFHHKSNVEIGDFFRCVSSQDIGLDNNVMSKISVHSGAKLIIGHHSGMTNSTINCSESITIGNYVNIGAGCLIVDSDFHSLDWRDRLDGTDIAKKKNSPVVIKDLAFIGAHCIILKGVTIGEKSIIGAGSVVVKNVPDGEIWAGNPAVFIKKTI